MFYFLWLVFKAIIFFFDISLFFFLLGLRAWLLDNKSDASVCETREETSGTNASLLTELKALGV